METEHSEKGRWLAPALVGIVLSTFLSDFGHEMATAVIPMYFASIGLGATALGAMEGSADLLYSLSKIAGGVIGNRIKHKREVASAGYAITALGIASMGLARAPLTLAILRAGAWMGRGFRAPLRDYLMSTSVPKTHYGRAYGVERSADMLGAVVGPLVALTLVAVGVTFHNVMLLSVVPSLGAAASIFFLRRTTPKNATPKEIQEATAKEGATAKTSAEAESEAKAKSAPLPASFYRFTAGVALFGMGDFSRSLLILLAARAIGPAGAFGVKGATLAVLLYDAHNVVSAIAAIPAGRLADRYTKRSVLIGGYAIGVATNGLLFLAHQKALAVACAVVLSGIYIAVEETVEKAAVASSVPKERRTFGFGILAAANSIGDMVSSIYVGVLLDSAHPSYAFAIAAALGAAGTLWIALFTPAQMPEHA